MTIVEAEFALGLDGDPIERHLHYERKRAEYEQWLLETAARHRWSFRDATCRNCGQMETPCVTAADIDLCLDCLSTPVPWYPTGWVQLSRAGILHHVQHCTSHSSSPTSNSTDSSDAAPTS